MFHAVALCIALLAAQPAVGDDADSRRDRVYLQLKWQHQFQFAGYYAAVEEGFYDDAGLEVVLLEGRPDGNVIDDVLSGRAQYGVWNVDVLRHRLEGAPIVLLAPIVQYATDIVIAHGEAGIGTPQELRGRAIVLDESARSILQAMLLSDGLEPGTVRFDLRGNGLERLLAGEVEATTGYITSAPFVCRQAGIPISIIQPRAYGVDFYGDCLFTSEQEAHTHPRRAELFREASLRGWRYALEHPEQIVEAIIEKYGSNTSREHLLFEAESLRRLVRSEQYLRIGQNDPRRWREIARTYERLGMVKPDASMKGFFFESLEDRRQQSVRMLLWGSVALLPVAFAALGVFAFLNKILRRRVVLQTADLQQQVESRHEIENSLRRSEERLRTIMEFAPYPALTLSTNGWILHANRAACDFLEASSGSLVGVSLEALNLPPQSRELLEEISCADAVSGDAIAKRNQSFSTPSGAKRFVEITCSRISWPGITGAVASCWIIDRTEQRRTEEAFRASEERYRGIVEDQMEIILRILPDATVSYINRSGARFFRRSPRWLIGRRIVDVLASEDVPKVSEMMALVSIENPVATVEESLRGADGRRYWHQWTFRAISHDCEHIAEYQGVARDVTAQKGAVQALLESEERFRRIYENAVMGIYRTTEDGRILMANPALLKMLGYNTFSEIRNLNLEKRDPGTDYLRDVFKRRIETDGEIRALESVWTCRDGRSINVIENARLVRDESERTQYYEGTVEDITERKRMEAERESYAERMELLHRIEGAILNAESSEEIAFVVLDRLKDILPFNRAEVVITEFQAQEVRLLATESGPSGHEQDEKALLFSAYATFTLLPLDKLREGLICEVDSVEALPEEDPLRRPCMEKGLASFVHLPLFDKVGLVGVMTLARSSVGRFSPDQIEIAREVCGSLALAIGHARLREQAQRDAETKAALLREVNHRVKNNLLSIVGMLETERSRAGEDSLRTVGQAMADLEGRIRGLTTVHEMLSATGWAHVDAGELARRIIESNAEGMVGGNRIDVRVSAHELTLSTDEAHYLALILSELVTNSLKYAWTGEEPGAISVDVRQEDGVVELLFSDNGPGFPENVIHDGPAAGQVGLRLIAFVVERNLRGELHLENRNGAVAAFRYRRAPHTIEENLKT